MPRPAARVLLLLDLLQSAGTRTRKELASELAVDERTVRRYVEHLRDLDIPVESVRGRYGGYRLAPGYRLPPLMLSDDEALAVLFALSQSAAAARSPGSQTAAATAIAKLRRALPQRLVERASVLQEAVVAAQGGAADEQPDPGVLLTVGEAVRTRTPLDVGYVNRADERTRRTVHPYELVVLQGRWYLIAYDTTRHTVRTFRCDRILDARTARGHFERPVTDPIDLAAEFASADYQYTVTLQVQAPIEQLEGWLPRTVATIEPGADDWQRVVIRAERLDWLPQRLLAIEAPVTIEGPPELKAVLTAAAARLAAMTR